MITQQNKIIELKLMEAIMEVKTWEELKDNATELNKKIDDMNFEEFSKSVILPSFLYTIYDFEEESVGFFTKTDDFSWLKTLDFYNNLKDNIGENLDSMFSNLGEKIEVFIEKIAKEDGLKCDENGKIIEFLENAKKNNDEYSGYSYQDFCHYYLNEKIDDKAQEICDKISKYEKEINNSEKEVKNYNKSREKLIKFFKENCVEELLENNPNLYEKFEDLKQDTYDKWRYIKEEHIKNGKNETLDYYNNQNQKEFIKCLEKIGLDYMVENEENYQIFNKGKKIFESFFKCESFHNYTRGIEDTERFELSIKNEYFKEKDKEDFEFKKERKTKVKEKDDIEIS